MSRVLVAVMMLMGCAAAQSVHLSWIQSTDATVASNNVYRWESPSGPWVEIYSSATPITSYTDATATPGLTYYYAVTAVDLVSGLESENSTETEIVAAFSPPTSHSALGP